MPWSCLREAFGEDKVGRSDGARRRVDDCNDRLVRRCVAQEGSPSAQASGQGFGSDGVTVPFHPAGPDSDRAVVRSCRSSDERGLQRDDRAALRMSPGRAAQGLVAGLAESNLI